MSALNFQGQRLVGERFTGDLRGADFSDCDLTGASFHALLDGANFKNARLIGGTLINSSAREAIFTGADLQGFRIVNSDITGADFTNVKHGHIALLAYQALTAPDFITDSRLVERFKQELSTRQFFALR